MANDSDNKSILTLPEKAVAWLHRVAYFVEYNKSPDEAVREWLEIKNERPINKKVQIDDNLVGWLCHDTYDNEQ